MADSSLSSAKAILLAVRFATKADLTSLRALIAQYPKTLRTDLILRIILTYLPESLDPSKYVPFLQDLAAGQISGAENPPIEHNELDDLSDANVIKRVRKLHLLPLAWPSSPPDVPDDPLLLFLIHRAYRIDEQTGLVTQLPELLAPFLEHSQYLRLWMISTLIPIIRLNYEFYPQESTTQTIEAFEALNTWAAVGLLLSRTGKSLGSDGDSHNTIGRDLRGLVGPWMYGESQWKRRKLRNGSIIEAQVVEPLNEAGTIKVPIANGWEEVFKWILSQATKSWMTCVEAIEQWDGPGDVDLGKYGNGTIWREEREQQMLERRYARAALAAAYLIPEPSIEALTGVQRILHRLVALMDHEILPTLSAAAAMLARIPSHDEVENAAIRNATQLRTGLMDEQNVLTTPNTMSIFFLHGLLISAFLFTRAGVPCNIRRAGELVLLQDEREQKYEVQRFIHKVGNASPKADDKYWIRVRNEILWLRDWGAEQSGGRKEGAQGRGIFGKLRKQFLEVELLKALLANTRYTLARSIYELSPDRPLSAQQTKDTVISAAMNAYDNATNANRTRGGVKKCDDIIHAFPDTIKGSLVERRIGHLMNVTHSVGKYRLVLKQGEPFTPVVLRVHGDPISIIGKILEQNPNSYTKINDLVHIAEEMVLSGLTSRDVEGNSILEPPQEEEQISIARKRVTSMCIDAALSEDDFETAYSYVMNRLSSVASEAQSRTPLLEREDSGIFAHAPPRVLDDWSWRAALQAGKYRPNSNTRAPTHLGNASGNLEIRRLEQRKECLSQALRIAPPATLHEILNVFRRCEEELGAKIEEEAEKEDAWDEQGDQTVMPGGFGVDQPQKPLRNTTNSTGPAEEAPMSLFDLTRASAAKAQSSLSALTMLTGDGSRAVKSKNGGITEVTEHPPGVGHAVRKRDQLRNAAVGTLASGIGWLINAPTPPSEGR